MNCVLSEINVLNPEVSNKVAAGEVVERPASIVKELIENSIDAGASTITLEIKKGGLEYIRVTDNGKGMYPGDAEKAFLRHATSKIKTADDLEKIATLGFRGEALSSIAAISKVTLLTKKEMQEGISLEIEGGIVVNNGPAGCPDGTTLIIRDVFFNTPARMKFLKTERTECGYITDLIERLALAHTKISIKYIVDGKVRMQTSGDGELLTGIYNVYGADYAKNSRSAFFEEDGITVEGYIGEPNTGRGNRNMQSFFVNGRYVKSRVLTAAAEEAYKTRLMVGKFPFFVLNLNISPYLVDVNVHPAKMEIKFTNDKQAFHSVYWAVKSAIERPSTPEDNAESKVKAEETNIAQNITQNIELTSNFPKVTTTKMEQESLKYVETPTPRRSGMVSTFIQEVVEKKEELQRVIDFPEALSVENNNDYKIIGQAFNTYIIVERGSELNFVDQHAAHERQLYEKLAKNNIMPQILMIPENIILTKSEVGVIGENIDFFMELGFEIDVFGDNAVMVRQTPLEIPTSDLKEVIIEIVNNLTSGSRARPERIDRALYTIACKAAIKANKRLDEKETEALIDWAFVNNGIETCPHGRPFTYSLTKYNLERSFGRA